MDLKSSISTVNGPTGTPSLPEDLLRRDLGWPAYIENEGLQRYPRLQELFNPVLRNTLLTDLTLRPVFLQRVPVSAIVSNELQGEMSGWRARLSQFCCLKISSTEAAERKAAHGNVVVGVVDRHTTTQSLMKQNPVAAGRQFFVPFEDGTWLGVKGSGQFNNDSKPQFFYNTEAMPTRFEGASSLFGAMSALSASTFIYCTGARRFVRPLGYCELPFLVNSDDILVPTSLVTMPVSARTGPLALSFNSPVIPNRLMKYPQQVAADPHLDQLCLKVSLALQRNGEIPPGVLLSGNELVVFIAKKIGETQAIKQNQRLFKSSFHSQDVTWAGEEADNEDFLDGDQYARYLKREDNADGETFFRYGISLVGVVGMIDALLDMVESPEVSKSSTAYLFPDPIAPFEALLEGYFSKLKSEFLEVWARENISEKFIVSRWNSENGLPSLINKLVPAMVRKILSRSKL